MSSELRHLDEARDEAIAALRGLAICAPQLQAAVLIDDIYGRISALIWVNANDQLEPLRASLAERLANACSQYWTGTVNVSAAPSPEVDDDALNQAAWREGIPFPGADRLRINDRYRHHTGWFAAAKTSEPLWSLEDGPPVLVFHGFKGGAGRTTLLAGYALSCAQRGDRVSVLDLDLDAPGIGSLLSSGRDGTAARWGTVDLLVEASEALPLQDYFHVCTRDGITGDGRIEVFPTGRLDDSYLSKLARVDLETRTGIRAHPLGRLIQRIRDERTPDVILLDGRAGLSPAAGLLLSGFAHLHVLVATSNPQNMQGLERIVRHLGFEQAMRGQPQKDCVVVQTMVPDVTDAARLARADFARRVEEMFRNGYYAREPAEDDSTWSLRDLESEVAPHVPVPISYRGRFAHFDSIDDVAPSLIAEPEYLALYGRLNERLRREDVRSAGGEVSLG